MKIRQGFVSNSSSSSFIVAFPRDFQISSDSVQSYLFAGQQSIVAYDWIGTFDTKQIADVVTSDMRAQTPNNHEAITEALGGHLPGAPSYEAFRKKKENGTGYDYDWTAYEEASSKYREVIASKIKTEFEGMDIYTFEYSDNDGNLYCTMEHGGIFDNVPNMRISNH